MLTRRYEKQITWLKALYEEHDHCEAVLLAGERRNAMALDNVWHYHDQLERLIIKAETHLPRRILDRLKERVSSK